MNPSNPISRRTVLLSLGLTLATASILCFCSCKNPSPGAPPQWVAVAATVAQNVTAIGVAADLQTHPEHRVAFQVAESALTGMIEKTNWNAAQFAAIISQLPVTELQGPEGILWVGTIVSVYDVVTSTVMDVQSAPAVEAVMRAVRDGLRAGLNAVSSRSASRMFKPKTKVPVNVKRVKI